MTTNLTAISIKGSLLLSILLLVVIPIHAESEVEHGPLKIWGAQEIGMLQGGIYHDQTGVPHLKFNDDWVDNFGAAFSKEAIIDEKYRVSVGIGGVFRFPKPERPDIRFAGSQAVWFFVGPSIAEGSAMLMGSYEEPGLEVAFGTFPYQYNPDAYNLGGYLFRSTAYPTTLTSGGFMMMNANAAQLQGLRFSYHAGDFHTDLLFHTETSFPPFYDLSVSLVADYKVSLLEVGAGVSFKRIVPMFADSTTPPTFKNSYFSATNPVDATLRDASQATLDFTGNTIYYSERKNVLDNILFSNGQKIDTLNARIADPATDPAQDLLLQAQVDALTIDTTNSRKSSDSLQVIMGFLDSLGQMAEATSFQKTMDSITGGSWGGHYTNQNISFMFRAALDFKKIISGNFAPNDLRLYTEINLLGIKDYPVYYEDKMNRMPVMFGFNIPTFGVFDLLAVQAEFFDSPYLNNHFEVGEGNVPQPFFNSANPYSENEFYDVTKDDNWYWSVLVRKEMLQGLTLSYQMGRDHSRVSSPGVFYGSREDPNEIFVRGDDWYWAFQLAWGL